MAGNSSLEEWNSQSSPGNRQFESFLHSTSLLSGLNQLRNDGKLLDITLFAEGEQFQAHRVVLASCSDYFRAMFTDAMKEAAQTEICLKGVTALGIELLIEYAYTSKLNLNMNNVQDILSAASHVQVDAVVTACSDYLDTQIDLENCVDIAAIADLYSLEKLKQKSYQFISSRLNEFSNTIGIDRLSADQFEAILRCDYPVDCSESEVLQIVVRWISGQKFDFATAYKLFEQVRFTEISSVDIQDMLIQFYVREVMNGQMIFDVMELVTAQKRSEEKFDDESKADPQIGNAVLTNIRGMEMALVKVGGFGMEGITNEITYYLPSRRKWHNLTEIPHVEQSNYGTAVVGNDLYIIGGCYDVNLREYFHPFGFRFCPMLNKWRTITQMQQDRARFSLHVVGNFLYAVGGVNEMNDGEGGGLRSYDRTESNCERYSIKSDEWEYISSLPEDRSQHAGVAVGNHLYICGGLQRNGVLSSLCKLDVSTHPSSEGWQNLAPMLTARADHVVLAIRDKIYACGGWYEDPITENRRLVETIDVYNIDKNTWEIETTIPSPKYHAGIVAVDTKIYMIGGLNSEAMFNRASSTVKCYDIDNKLWHSLDRYPQNIWECTCVTLYVPRCRDDTEVIVDECDSS